MSSAIQELIDQRPHLQDPLELYGKLQEFCRQAEELLAGERAALTPEGPNGYPADRAGQVFALFVAGFGLDASEFEPLRRTLEDGAIDFMRLPVDETPLPLADAAEDELTTLLFLLGRPYFQLLRRSIPLDGSAWEEGRCPLCSARAALASVVEGPQRRLHCTYCGTTGSYRFIGCPGCGTADPTHLTTIVADEEPGFRVSACDNCHTYTKVIESSVLSRMDMDQADMVSLPLDIVAQNRGYARLAPNPIGLKKIG